MLKRPLCATAVLSLMLLTTGCVSNTFLGYGKVPKDAVYAAMIPGRRAMGKIAFGDVGDYVTGVALHGAGVDQADLPMALEPEAPFSWPMCIVNIVPLTWISMMVGELQRTGQVCYRVLPGSHSFSVEYVHFAVTEKRTFEGGYELRGDKISRRREITGTFEPGRRYFLCPELPDPLLSEQEWKDYSARIGLSN